MGEPASRVIFYVSMIILLSNLYAWPIVTGLFLLRFIIQMTVFALNRKKLNEPGILPLFPIFDLLLRLLMLLYLQGVSEKEELIQYGNN